MNDQDETAQLPPLNQELRYIRVAEMQAELAKHDDHDRWPEDLSPREKYLIDDAGQPTARTGLTKRCHNPELPKMFRGFGAD